MPNNQVKKLIGKSVSTNEGDGNIVGYQYGSYIIDLNGGGTITRTTLTKQPKLGKDDFKLKESILSKKQEKILENFIRREVRKSLNEDNSRYNTEFIQTFQDWIKSEAKKRFTNREQLFKEIQNFLKNR